MAAKNLKKILSLSLMFLFFCQVATAQVPEERSSTGGPRKQLATIVFAGLAGAIMGLSTLSFYGRPQEKLSNIAVGFAVGIIIGTGYTLYQAAAEPRVQFEGQWNQPYLEPEVPVAYTPKLAYSWSFE